MLRVLYIVSRLAGTRKGEPLVKRGTILRKIRQTTELPVKSHASRSQLCTFQLLSLLMIVFLGCAICAASTSRLYPPSDDESGGLRFVQVMQLATREEILKLGEQLEHLHASGIRDSDFRDGSVAMARIYCCHPSTDGGTAIWFYTPPDLQVQVGDLVVVRMGRKVTKKDAGKVNLAVEVREHKDTPNSQCSWDPPDETKWRRLLYCKWMPAEGWTLKKSFLHETWFKPPDAKAQ
jgi:hypothetical protein